MNYVDAANRAAAQDRTNQASRPELRRMRKAAGSCRMLDMLVSEIKSVSRPTISTAGVRIRMDHGACRRP